MKVIVLIPAWNEEATIGKLIHSIPRTILSDITIEIVVIDDGSKDGTSVVARNSGAEIIVRHSENAGVGQALKTGIKTAIAHGADIIVNIDADGQFNPLEIPLLVKPIADDRADLVLGSRFLSRSKDRIPVQKRIGNVILSKMISILSGKQISDSQCGFRAFSREAALNLELSGYFTYTQEMILECSFNGYRVIDVPVSVRYFEGRKSRVVKGLLSYLLKASGVILLSVIRNFWRKLLLIDTILFLIIFVLMISYL